MSSVGMSLVINLDSKGAISGVKTLRGEFNGLKKGVRGGSADISAGAAKMQRGFSGLARTMSRVAMLGKVALAGLAVATVITGAKFEQSMANVASVANANEQQLSQLTATARKWGQTTAFTASQVAEGMYALASAGQKTVQIQQSVGGVLLYAGAAATSMSNATETTVQALKMFNLRATATNRVVDVLTGGIANSMLTADRLKDSLSYVGATAHAMNMSIEDTVAALGGLHNAGMMGSMAGTKLRGVLVRLANPNAKLRELMGGLTVESDGLAAVMGQLASQSMTTGETFKAFGRIAGSGALAMMQLGQEGLEQMTEKVSVSGTAWKMYEKQMATVSSQFKIFKSAMQENMIAAFMALRPLIMDSVKAMQAWANKIKPYIIGAAKELSKFVTEKKESIKAFVSMAAKGLLVVGVIMAFSKAVIFTRGVITGLVGAGQLVIGLFKTMRAGIVLTKTIWASNMTMIHLSTVGPWVLLGVAVAAALVGIVALVYKFRSQIKSVFDSVVDFFRAVGGKIRDILSKPFTFVVDKIKWFAEKVGSIINVLYPGFSKATATLFNNIKTKVDDLHKSSFEKLGAGFDFAKGKAGDMATGFSTAIDNMKSKLPDLIGKLKSLGSGSVEMNINTTESGSGKGQSDAQKAAAATVKAAESDITMLADKRKASWLNVIDANSAASRTWLATKLEMINTEYQDKLEGENLTETQIAAMRIEKDAAVRDAKLEHHRAFVAEWQAGNDVMFAGVAALSAAYDTFFSTILDKEMTGKQRREAMWTSMQRSFLSGMARMLKKYIIMKMKNILIGEAMEKTAHAKTKLLAAKEGAVKAYSAFASIPLVGPIIGAAAAAAAFAFLIAFHKGGSVDESPRGLRANEVPAVLERNEYVIQRSSAQSVGTESLDYINATGRLPYTGGGDVNLSFSVEGGGGLDVDSLREFVEDTILPQIEDGLNRGAWNSTPEMVLT